VLDCDPSYFGCGNKVPAFELASMTNNEDYSFLLPDNGTFKGFGQNIHSTIDTVFPFTKDIKLFTTAAFYHCANDLFIDGILPSIATVSVGLSSYLDSQEIETLFNKLNELFEYEHIVCQNFHTYKADQTSITISFTGWDDKKLSNKQISPNQTIFLTKPLGHSVLFSDESNCLTNLSSIGDLTHSARDLALLLRNHEISVATDVSGFGLIGHLSSILDTYNYDIDLFLDLIPRIENFESLCSEYGLTCSARSNVESFMSKIANSDEMKIHETELLFSGEINGPMLFILDENDESDLNFKKEVEKITNVYKIGVVSSFINRPKKINLIRGTI
tara:strand:- start:4171 stop:5166 length:996 start_codon:yes stop_codon:yes gene_type:complete